MPRKTEPAPKGINEDNIKYYTEYFLENALNTAIEASYPRQQARARMAGKIAEAFNEGGFPDSLTEVEHTLGVTPSEALMIKHIFRAHVAIADMLEEQQDTPGPKQSTLLSFEHLIRNIRDASFPDEKRREAIAVSMRAGKMLATATLEFNSHGQAVGWAEEALTRDRMEEMGLFRDTKRGGRSR